MENIWDDFNPDEEEDRRASKIYDLDDGDEDLDFYDSVLRKAAITSVNPLELDDLTEE